jgi:hypothetical protein
MKFFTMLWRQDTCADHKARGWSGKLLRHMGSNQFTARGVGEGDRIFAVATRRGKLVLLGAFTVGEVSTSRSHVRSAVGYEPWESDEYVISVPGTETPIDFDNLLPDDVTAQMVFVTARGLTRAVFRDPGRLDQQTLRGIRQLSSESALLLEEYLRT